MRIIVIVISVVVALALALIALLSDEEVIAKPEKENPEEDETSIGWQIVDFMNGKFLWRQYVRCRGKDKEPESSLPAAPPSANAVKSKVKAS